MDKEEAADVIFLAFIKNVTLSCMTFSYQRGKYGQESELIKLVDDSVSRTVPSTLEDRMGCDWISWRNYWEKKRKKKINVDNFSEDKCKGARAEMDDFHPPQDKSFCYANSFRKFCPTAKINYFGFGVASSPSPPACKKSREKLKTSRLHFSRRKPKSSMLICSSPQLFQPLTNYKFLI